jgi:hypothetical protein
MTTPEIIVCNAVISVIVGLIVVAIVGCMTIKTKGEMEYKLAEIEKTIRNKDWDSFKDISDIRRDCITFECNIRKEMREMREMLNKTSQINKNTVVSCDCSLAEVFFETVLNESCIDYVIGVRRTQGFMPTCCYKHTVLPSKWNREEAENAPEPEIISNNGSIVIFKHFDVIYKYIVQENVCYLA